MSEVNVRLIIISQLLDIRQLFMIVLIEMRI